MVPRLDYDGFLTTGQAAQLCSVTPDAVLKWVKSGKLVARRTGGGHYRIPARELSKFLGYEVAHSKPGSREPHLQFCWEFQVDAGRLPRECRDCIIYRTRTARCYELAKLPEIARHLRHFCTCACEECNYYKTVRGARFSILVATDRPETAAGLLADTGPMDFNLRVAECEYNLAVMVGTSFPDFVVIDCSMGIDRARQTARYVLGDSRVPFTRVIMAGDQSDFPEDCDRDIFAFIARPLTIPRLQSLLAGVKKRNLR